MDKLKLYGCACILATAAFTFTACGDDDDDDDDVVYSYEEEETTATWTTDDGLKACDHILFTEDGDDNVSDEGTQIGNGDKEFVFTGTQTLEKGTYTLKGWVYIADGAELTIEAGSVVRGDKDTQSALIVERGGKLIAEGTSTSPIVFTSGEEAGSRKPGDWGGLIICGKAQNNQDEMQIEGGPRTKHGGDDDDDNSGILSYVRIEFAGYPFETDEEINGLTLGSVGSGTQIDHVQVSYSNDDSFEWFGGCVDCKYLIAYKGWDDDFDTDNGFSGNVQFCLSVRDSKIADQSQSNGFESDNCADGSDIDPHTTAVFSNVTFIGPKAVDDDFENTTDYITAGDYYPNNGSGLGRFQAAMHIRRDSYLSCFNSVAVGWPIGIILDSQKGDSQAAATDGDLKIQNVWFAGMDAIGTDFNKIYYDGLYNYDTETVDSTQASFSSTYFTAQTGNQYFDEIQDDWFDSTGYMPASGSDLLDAASFSDSKVSSGFDQVSYIGAFAEDDTWLDDWTNFDPQNTEY